MSEHPGRRVLVSGIRDAVSNLAMEESLLASVGSGDEILFLYENEPSVVIGRFQNPWKECRTGLAARSGVPVLRRISGGGTVVHGPGNLNFSVISGVRTPEKERNLDLVIRGMKRLGVALVRNSRSDLRLPGLAGTEGAKVSGSAFRQVSGSSMHHATLLVDSDLDSLKELLHQPPRNMAVRGVASVPSPVANLAEVRPGLDVGSVIQALAAEWGTGCREIAPADLGGDEVFLEARERLASPEWTWGRTPEFSETFGDLPGFPDDELVFRVAGGRVAEANPEAAFLVGSAYSGQSFLDAAAGDPPAWLLQAARRVDGD